MKKLNKSVRPLLGHFLGHLGDTQSPILSANNTFWGPPFMFFCRLFSHLATVQQIWLTKAGFYAKLGPQMSLLSAAL